MQLDAALFMMFVVVETEFDPFSERAHRSQMLALYALGRQHEALAAYRRYRRRLGDELGLEPTAETRRLEAAILRQDDVRELVPRKIVHDNRDDRSVTAQLRQSRPQLRIYSQGLGTR